MEWLIVGTTIEEHTAHRDADQSSGVARLPVNVHAGYGLRARLFCQFPILAPLGSHAPQ